MFFESYPRCFDHISIFFNFSAIINKHIRMKRLVVMVLAIGLLGACRSGHNKQGSEAMAYDAFRKSFPAAGLPYKMPSDAMSKSDSGALDEEAVTHFLTDTLGGGQLHKFYPLAYITGRDVNFFAVKAAAKSGNVGYLCFMDKKGHYLGSMRVARQENNFRQYFSIDNKQLLKVTGETSTSPGHTSTKEDFFSINAAGKTTLIMTNSTGDAVAGQLFNPIDTLAAKHKLSGDYTSGEMNLVSIRDGEDGKSFQFFITFSREGGCKGELLGTGRFTGANKGEYTDKETECGIAFQFSGNKLSIREIGGCGAYRGVRCFFEGSFTKKESSKKK